MKNELTASDVSLLKYLKMYGKEIVARTLIVNVHMMILNVCKNSH